MIGVTKLLCGTATPSDALRYGRDNSKLPARLLQFSKDAKPVVVWNMTRSCNLRCIHCYAEARQQACEGELTTQEAEAFIDDLAEMGAPVLLFSGGEPFMREDLFELGAYAVSKGIRAVISTNGTLITDEMARKVKEAGFQYVGISVDGMQETNDRFRGQKGAFEASLHGIRNCRAAGVRVGLRFTISQYNYEELGDIFDLLVAEGVPRCCFYHLVYAGRGTKIARDDLSLAQTREAVGLIFQRTQQLHRDKRDVEVLTVDNHTDGPYLYRKVQAEQPARAEEVITLLRMNGGNGSGIRIGAVDYLGNVHADQFWTHYSFGNVRERKFSDIWYDTSDALMRGLKDRKPLLKGRCGKCQYIDICNGNFRVRAEAVHGDVWAPDPACYLTDEEIGIA